MKRTTLIVIATLIIIAYLIYTYLLKEGEQVIADRYSNIAGCTDPSAYNYNPLATEDDGNCFFTGCPDPTANIYDANCDGTNPLCIPWGGICDYSVGTTGCCDPISADYDANCLADADCMCDNAMCSDQVPNQIWTACCNDGYENYNSTCQQDPMCSCDGSLCTATTGYSTCYSECGGVTGQQVSSIEAPTGTCGQGYALNFPNANMPNCQSSGGGVG